MGDAPEDSPDGDGRGAMRQTAQVVAGFLLGALAGIVVVLAIVAFRASVEEIYLHSFGELFGWLGLPALLGPVVGVWAAVRAGVGSFWRGVGVVAATLVVGAAVGAGIGAVASVFPADTWAGGIVGAGAGILLAGAVLAVRDFKGGSSSVATATPFLLLSVAACGGDPPPQETRTFPPPEPGEVEAVVFLLGDPGVALTDRYPVLPRLRQEIERWSGALGEEGHLAMAVLGDIVYPSGLHPADHSDRRRDSLYITSQLDLIGGPEAEEAGTRALFIPGNHDWGQEEDWKGAVRLVRLEDFLDAWEGPGAGRAEVVPEPGTGGPAVIDMGANLRLVLLDTAWWLLGSDPAAKSEVIDSVRTALRTAGERRVVMAAHHPLETGGPHGVSLGRYLGFRALLQKAGILLQDLQSRPYHGFVRRLTSVFDEEGYPDLFVGGHEHSLQVFSSWETASGRSLVVGSGSKLTEVRDAPDMLFGRSEPGFGTIFVLRDGSLHYRLTSAPARFLSCKGEARDRARCMREGVGAFRTVWAEEVEAGS